MILNHRSLGNTGLRTFEEFAKCHLPSKPEISLASILLDQISWLNVKGKTIQKFEVEICKIILKQWSNCSEEKYVSIFNNQIETLEISPVSVSTNSFIKQSHTLHSSIKQNHVESPPTHRRSCSSRSTHSRYQCDSSASTSIHQFTETGDQRILTPETPTPNSTRMYAFRRPKQRRSTYQSILDAHAIRFRHDVIRN